MQSTAPYPMCCKNQNILKAINAARAKTHNTLVRCSSEMPFFPGAQKVIDLVRGGEMGEIIEVECAFLHSSDLDPNKQINWKRMEDVNGDYGCMGDLGMHVLRACMYFMYHCDWGGNRSEYPPIS